MNTPPFTPHASPDTTAMRPPRAFALFIAASTLCLALCVLCIIGGGGSTWNAAAAVCASLMLNLSLAAGVTWLSALIRGPQESDDAGPPMDHRKVSLPQPRQAPLGHVCAARACTFVEIIALLGLVPVVVFIILTVMGAAEPRW